jgi:ribosomal protein L24
MSNVMTRLSLSLEPKKANGERSSRWSPKKERVIVEGINMIKKHVRRNQQHPEGAIIEREGAIHISNVMKAERYDAKRGNT